MDINLLSNILKELILDNDRVSLPGMGSFIAEMAPSVFSDRAMVIHPPFRRILFRSSEIWNDGLLEANYAVRRGVTEDVAKHEINEFLKRLRIDLNTNKVYKIPGFGSMRATEQNDYFFVADKELFNYLEGFGLAPINVRVIPKRGEVERLSGKPVENYFKRSFAEISHMGSTDIESIIDEAGSEEFDPEEVILTDEVEGYSAVGGAIIHDMNKSEDLLSIEDDFARDNLSEEPLSQKEAILDPQQEPTQVSQQELTQVSQQEPPQELHQEPIQELQQEPVQVSQQEPKQVLQQEPTQVSQQEPPQELHQEPIQVLQQEPTQVSQQEIPQELHQEPYHKLQQEPIQVSPEHSPLVAKGEKEKIESAGVIENKKSSSFVRRFIITLLLIFLLIAAVGALYVFKDELRPLWEWLLYSKEEREFLESIR
jgi:hypothetical protein